jgi:RNA polymerase sigma-70 factor (ECF subfamily)
VTGEPDVPQLVDHLFRHQAGQMVSSLTRLFGVENLELVENIVQETLLKALQQWPYRGIPENPGGWLWQVAKNHALDVVRSEARSRKIMKGGLGLMEPGQVSAEAEAFDLSLEDDQLSMMFIGCHPRLSRDAQVTLLLKTVGGFNVAEIARAFLLPEATIAQRLVRAKNQLTAEGVRFELPPGLNSSTGWTRYWKSYI